MMQNSSEISASPSPSRERDKSLRVGERSRSHALDALRGIAIIGMVLSGTIANTLPAWMYHAQVGPRSAMKFDPSFVGITWVDLVFPFFLFAMGAAFPLALGRKLDKGESILSMLPAILKRVFLLLLFAIAIYHCSPYRLGGEWNFALALLAFLLFFATFVRLPKLSIKQNAWLNNSGIVLLMALIAFNVISQPEVFSKGFKLSHNDIIILVLANMAFFGAIIWLLTPRSWMARISILAVFFALRLTSGIEGSWNQLLWQFNPAQLLPETITQALYNPGGWLYRMDFLKYLFIIIPGTIAGDIMRQTLRPASDSVGVSNTRKALFAAFLMLAFVLCNLICLYERWLVANLFINIVLAIMAYVVLRKPQSTWQTMHFKFLQWGIALLFIGLAFEAFEGGIRKDSATMSYFFVTAGLAFLTLIFFSVIIDIFGKIKFVQYIVDCGQNPMLAYVAGTFFVVPLLVFSGLMPHINKLHEIAPWMGLLKGIIITGGMMGVTVFTVRRKWFWKS